MTDMTREEEIEQAQIAYIGYDWEVDEGCGTSLRRRAFESGARWADEHISDATIMRVLNAIGYEEESWIEFVRKRL